MRLAISAALGGLVIFVVALPLASFHSEPVLIDRAFPLIALSLWILASRSIGTARERAYLLVPVSFVIEIAVPDATLRLLFIGATLAVAVALSIRNLRDEWEPFELLTAVAILVPLRLVQPGWPELLIQALLVAGAVLLWRELRRGGVEPALTAAAVTLLVVSLPVGSIRLALVPLVLVFFVHGLRNRSWAASLIAVAAGALAARWLGLTIVLVFAAIWSAGRLRAFGAPAFVPSLRATLGNVPAAVASLAFFAPLFRPSQPIAVMIGPLALALVVRPSLAAPIVATGIIAACAIRSGDRSGPATDAAMLFPSLVLTAIIMLFFAWSGAIVARPPAPVPLFVILAIGAIALLPATVKGWSGVVAVVLVAAVVTTVPARVERRQGIGKALIAGETVSIPLEAVAGDLELWMAAGNLAGAARGRSIATVEVLDATGRGYSRGVEIGEVADWGAFRPDLVLRTLNPRPDDPAIIEGFGATSWVRGTGRVQLAAVTDPRWIVVTASPELEAGGQVFIEEVRFR